MEHSKIIELVLWEFRDNVNIQQGKEYVLKLNEFVKMQPGFISRITSVTKEGKFLDIIYWSDLASAKKASEKAMENEMTTTIFSTMNEKGMIFQHFEIFNMINK
ncbi:conserved hypothetical protein [Tenacibaculum sp. 190524A05c]|uniref:hypothetical protein n=1 Tax=Tenacibaculum platacis TaxID=3137852 RepID=UPI0031FA5964